MNSWPINLSPLSGELLSSWLIRTSIGNGTDLSSLSNIIWPGWRALTLDIDRYLPEDKLRKLSHVSGLKMKALYNMTLHPTIKQIVINKELNYKQSWSWVIPTGNRNKTRINGLHFCPKCLSESPVYYKRSWRLAWNIACEKHHLKLINNCPNCNKTFSPHLITYNKSDITRCVRCNFHLADTPVTLAQGEAFWLQEQLNKTLLGSSSLQSTLNISHEDIFAITYILATFFQSSMRPLISFKNLHNALDIPDLMLRNRPASGTRFEARSNDERHNLFIAVSRLLKLTTEDIISILCKSGITQQMFPLSNDSPRILQEIRQSLPNNKAKQFTRSLHRKSFKPKSKKEVDAMMADIEQYL